MAKDALFRGENKLALISQEEHQRFLKENSWESRFQEFAKYL